MVGALVVTAIVSISLIIFGIYYYFDPLGSRTSTRTRAESGMMEKVIDGSPITPIESKFARYLYNDTNVTPTVSSLSSPTVSPLPTPFERPTMSAKLASDKHSIILEFGNLSGVSRITYSVTYLTKTGNKGISGTIEIASPSAPIKRNITLGVCSKNVCVYDEITTPIDVLAIFRRIDGIDFELMERIPY